MSSLTSFHFRGAELARLEIPARAARLREFRDAIKKHLKKAGCGEQEIHDVVLAVDEACQNIIRHAYGGETDQPIVLEIRRDGPKFILYLRDFADPVEIDKIKSRDLSDVKPGGLGVHFIHEVMDQVTITPLDKGEGNVITLVKNVQ